MIFRVGMTVVCLRTFGCHELITKAPIKGGVYTVRDIEDDGDGPGLRFNELVNPFGFQQLPDGRLEYCEGTFAAEYFRPVKTTSIDVFLKMLESEGINA